MDRSVKKVIIADDHASSVLYLSVLLRRMGFQVIPAENGAAALKMMKMSPPDLVILDYTMPVMDGLTALRHIKSDADLQHIPVIMITAHSHREGLNEFRKLGAFGCVTKPINIDSLHALLQKCITYPGGKKRRHLRTDYHKDVSVTCNGLSRKFYTVSLSERGVYLRTKDPFPAGTELDISLPVGPGGLLRVRGDVIYHKDVFSASIDPGMAVEFKNLSANDEEILTACIMGTLAGDLLEEQDEKIISAKG
jgi:two-component system chemotaxis response regulator CheY